MALYGGISANNAPSDRIIRTIEQRDGGATVPRPLATHGYLIRRVPGYDKGVEGRWPRVALFDPSSKDGQLTRTYRIPCTDAQEEAVWRAALNAVGTPYDLAGLVVCGWFILTKQEDRWYTSRHASAFCTEGTTLWLRAGGIPILMDATTIMPADNVDPVEYEDWIIRYGYPEDPAAARVEGRAAQQRQSVA